MRKKYFQLLLKLEFISWDFLKTLNALKDECVDPAKKGVLVDLILVFGDTKVTCEVIVNEKRIDELNKNKIINIRKKD